MPEIIDLVVLSGWERKARMVGLVASRTWEEGADWAQIGYRELAALGRTRSEARWDIRTLERLVDDCVLLKSWSPERRRAPHHAGGATPRYRRSWRLNATEPDDLELWNVPWSSPVAEVVRHVRDARSRARPSLSRVIAGSGGAPSRAVPPHPLFWGPPENLTWAFAWPERAKGNDQRATFARWPDVLPGQDLAFRALARDFREPDAPSFPSSGVSSKHSLTSEGVRDESSALGEAAAGARAVAAALSAAIGCQVFGAPLRDLAAYIDKNPGCEGRLAELALTMGRWKTATGAVAALLAGVAAEPARATSAWFSCTECGMALHPDRPTLCGMERCPNEVRP